MIMINYMSTEFQRFAILPFDRLNILDVRRRVNEMYKRMESIIVREYISIARKAYRDAARQLSIADDDFDPYEFVWAMLRDYDPVSDFVYTREYTRKRDRMFESVIATEQGNQEMRRNLKRGLDVLAKQVRQYADIITVKARIKAFEKAKVKYVRWMTEKDEKVCTICAPRDGVVYRIDDIPGIPAHWMCRCILFPASESDYLAQQTVR
jgi:SPP1 gp7 family putative phage head morphogenesis protein